MQCFGRLVRVLTVCTGAMNVCIYVQSLLVQFLDWIRIGFISMSKICQGFRSFNTPHLIQVQDSPFNDSIQDFFSVL